MSATGAVVVTATAKAWTSRVFGQQLRRGLLGSMGRVASSVGNALIESFFSSF